VRVGGGLPPAGTGRPWCTITWNGLAGWVASAGLVDGQGRSPVP
jgi:uncharacterized protein YraI